MKGIRLRFSMSPHDMEVRANSAVKFLDKGYKVRVELFLRGRQKSDNLSGFSKEKVALFLDMIKAKTEVKIERELKKEGRGLTVIIAKP